MAYSWADLGALSLARQFPQAESGWAPRDPAAVARMVRRIGPIQSQTARAPYLALAARLPGVDLETISAAYDELLIVRGSTIRGTVHTSTPADHPLLEAATRIGQRALWQRTLKLRERSLEDVWQGIEDFARDHWRTTDELGQHLRDWLAAHDPEAPHALASQVGRYFAFGHGGLLRRPLKGGWQGQGTPGYRSAAALLGERTDLLRDPDAAMEALVRRHLASFGPASRHDLAWWAGVGLRVVDAALERLTTAGEVVADAGPDGRTYLDLPGADEVRDLPGPLLLPEFDALLCGYDPKSRDRFVDPEHNERLWSRANGLMLAPLLVGGRLTGCWRLVGSGRERTCEVTWFAGTRRPTKQQLEQPVAALETAYGVTVTRLEVTRGNGG